MVSCSSSLSRPIQPGASALNLLHPHDNVNGKHSFHLQTQTLKLREVEMVVPGVIASKWESAKTQTQGCMSPKPWIDGQAVGPLVGSPDSSSRLSFLSKLKQRNGDPQAHAWFSDPGWLPGLFPWSGDHTVCGYLSYPCLTYKKTEAQKSKVSSFKVS